MNPLVRIAKAYSVRARTRRAALFRVRFNFDPNTRILDLGSGGGFPGIPLAISHPESRLTLLDSTRKKAEFLERAVAALKLTNAQALWGRAEEILRKRRFDVVLAQGVKSTRELLLLLQPVQKSFSFLALMKGKSWPSESSPDEELKLSFSREAVHRYEISGTVEERYLLLFRVQ